MATAPALANRYQFTPRAQLSGVVALLCPSCGRIGIHRITPGKFKVRCTFRLCKKQWLIGIRVLDPAAHKGPVAIQTPDDIAFPVAALEEFTRSTRNIHELKTFAPVSYRAKKKRSVEPKDYSASNLKRSQSLRRYYQQKQALTNQQPISTESATDPPEV